MEMEGSTVLRAPEKRRMEKVEEIEDKGCLHSRDGKEL